MAPVTNKTMEDLNEIMCALPRDLFVLSQRATEAWYNFGSRYLLKEASERIGLTAEEILFWWDN